ncbi:MAG: DUF2804 domain-containing protein [Spirochaetaceae bacterium]|jgi:hypothetical protein|nr:DUF2804 domain-containing protein [Spirochaetaceae bacterium]
MIQTEIESVTPIFSEDGLPRNFGWARSPLFTYAPPPLIPAGLLSETNSYVIFSTTHLFVFELINDGWMRSILITALSIREKRVFTKVINISGSIFMLPPSCESGSIKVQETDSAAHFIVMPKGSRIIKIDVPRFDSENTLRGELVLTSHGNPQSLVTTLPWPKEKGRFQHIRCSPWYQVEGVMQFENKDVVFSRNMAWGIFLWRRILRPRQDIHFWAAGCGKSGDRQIGFSLGYGSVDASRATENAFFADGKLYKLEHITFKISPASWTRPWVFTSNDNSLQMTFKPIETDVQRFASIFHSASIRRVYGVFSGKLALEGGRHIEFHNITGLAERRKTWK